MTNLVLTVFMLIALTYLVQWLVPGTRGRPGAGTSVRRDIAPIMGFLGLVLLLLSMLESMRRAAMLAWGLGSALGLVAAVGLWVALSFWWSLPRPESRSRPSTLRILFSIVRTYGLVILVGLLGLNIAIRVFGAAFEVFLSGALGVLVIGTAAAVYVRVAGRP